VKYRHIFSQENKENQMTSKFKRIKKEKTIIQEKTISSPDGIVYRKQNHKPILPTSKEDIKITNTYIARAMLKRFGWRKWMEDYLSPKKCIQIN
jgi:hypothetical protein